MGNYKAKSSAPTSGGIALFTLALIFIVGATFVALDKDDLLTWTGKIRLFLDHGAHLDRELAEEEARLRANRTAFEEARREAKTKRERDEAEFLKQRDIATKKVTREEARHVAESKKAKSDEVEAKAAEEKAHRKAETHAKARRDADVKETQRKAEEVKEQHAANGAEAKRAAEEKARRDADAKETQRKSEEAKEQHAANGAEAKRAAEEKARRDVEEKARNRANTSSQLSFTDHDVREAANAGRCDELREYVKHVPHMATKADKNGWQAIHEASRAGHVDCARAILDIAGREVVNAETRAGKTPLFLTQNAGLGEDHPIFTFLKEHGAVAASTPGEAEKKVAEKNAAELKKASDERARRTAEEKARKAAVDFTDDDVREAASTGSFDTLRVYLERAPQMATMADKNGWQAIHEASRAGHVDCARAIVYVAGTEIVNAETVSGKTPLFLAQNAGLDEEHPLVIFLNGHGAVAASTPGEAERKLAEVKTPIDFTDHDVREVARTGDCKKLRRYLQRAPQMATKADQNGWQAIHEATRAGHVDCVRAILDVAGSGPANARTNSGRTPLFMAQSVGFEKEHPMVTLLKEHWEVDDQGRTEL